MQIVKSTHYVSVSGEVGMGALGAGGRRNIEQGCGDGPHLITRDSTASNINIHW